MAPYSDVWDPAAEDELTEIWRRSPDRSAVVRAADLIDRRLCQDPHRHGIPLSEGLWEITVPPLRAYYQIDDVKKEVNVQHVNEVA
jgi:hypothetical protein